MSTVQIIGVGPGAVLVPSDTDSERWCMNHPRAYRRMCPQALETYTRWFNVHSAEHIARRYSTRDQRWYRQQTKPIVLQESFPAATLMRAFRTRYFTCSLAWLLALAIHEGFERIELWGFSGDHNYEAQRPCIAWWVQRADDADIDVWIPAGVDFGPPGDPGAYTGPLYGYETT